jgi:hypothetical protein
MKFVIFRTTTCFSPFLPSSVGYSLCKNFVIKVLQWIHVVSFNDTTFLVNAYNKDKSINITLYFPLYSVA